MQKKVRWRGKDVFFITDGFDNTQPLGVINLPNEDSLLMNISGIHPDLIGKKAAIKRLKGLAEQYGDLKLLAASIANRNKPTGREITVNGVVFVEALFETKEELVTAFIPKSKDVKEPARDANAPTESKESDWVFDDKHPFLFGELLGRKFNHIKTNQGYRLLLGPVVARAA